MLEDEVVTAQARYWARVRQHLQTPPAARAAPRLGEPWAAPPAPEFLTYDDGLWLIRFPARHVAWHTAPWLEARGFTIPAVPLIRDDE